MNGRFAEFVLDQSSQQATLAVLHCDEGIQVPRIDAGSQLAPHFLPEGRELEVEFDGHLAVQVDDGSKGERQAHIPKLHAGLGRGDRPGLFRAYSPGSGLYG